MTRLMSTVILSAGIAGIEPGRASVCSASGDDDLLSALGGWGHADGLAGWSEADGLAGLEGLEGDDDAEIGRKVRRAARQANIPASVIARAMAQRGGGTGGVLPAAPAGSPREAFMSSIVPGTPQRGERFSWMSFPANAFTNAGGVTSIILKTTSQRYIRPVRMSYTERRTGAASILTTIREVKIGQEVQPAATGDAGTDCFSPFAVGIPVQFDPIEVNMPVEITVAASALPTGTDRIDFSVTLFGWMLK